MVVLRNADAAILAEAGGRQVYKRTPTRYSDLQPRHGLAAPAGLGDGSRSSYLAAFRAGPGPGHHGARRAHRGAAWAPIGGVKWIANYDNQFKGPIPVRQALAESRNAVAVWIAREIGIDKVIRTARELGIRTPLQPYISTALGASEVRLLELAGAYRAMACGDPGGASRHRSRAPTPPARRALRGAPDRARDQLHGPSSRELSLIQEGCAAWSACQKAPPTPSTAPDFPIPVMGKTGTTSDFRDALFVGSTSRAAGHHGGGPHRLRRQPGAGSEGNRRRAPRCRSSARSMLRIYQARLAGPVPQFPREIEEGIDDTT